MPTLPIHDFVGVSGIGAGTLGTALQENETDLLDKYGVFLGDFDEQI